MIVINVLHGVLWTVLLYKEEDFVLIFSRCH